MLLQCSSLQEAHGLWHLHTHVPLWVLTRRVTTGEHTVSMRMLLCFMLLI